MITITGSEGGENTHWTQRWKANKPACISLAISSAQMLVILYAIIFGNLTPRTVHVAFLIALIPGVPAAFGFALAGVWNETRPGPGFLATVAALLCGLFLSLQLLV